MAVERAGGRVAGARRAWVADVPADGEGAAGVAGVTAVPEVSVVGMRRRRATVAADLPLPAVGAVVAVSLGEQSWTTRVEHADARHVEVVAPTQPRGAAVLPDPGAPVRIDWPTPGGQMVADGALTATTQDVVTLWRVTVSRVERRQRRRSFRLGVRLPVAVRWDGGIVDTRTSDVSEHGLGCVLPAGRAPATGTVLEVALQLPDGSALVAAAQVVRARPASRAVPGEAAVEAGLAFLDDDPSRREVLRRFVLEEQLRRRAVERG